MHCHSAPFFFDLWTTSTTLRSFEPERASDDSAQQQSNRMRRPSAFHSHAVSLCKRCTTRKRFVVKERYTIPSILMRARFLWSPHLCDTPHHLLLPGEPKQRIYIFYIDHKIDPSKKNHKPCWIMHLPNETAVFCRLEFPWLGPHVKAAGLLECCDPCFNEENDARRKKIE